MDALSFIAELARALAWPACVIMLVYFLRHPLNRLLSRTESIEYNAFRVAFQKNLGRVEAEARNRALPSGQEATEVVVGGHEPAAEKYRRLADASPRAAIIEAWRDVLLALIAVAREHDFEDLPPGGHPDTRNVIARLVQEGVLDQDSQRFLDRLRDLRNQAGHMRDLDLSADEAIRFGLLSARIVAKLAAEKEQGAE